jgi:hypothetical protein
MKENAYDGLLEQWKVELIVRRAQRKCFRPDEVDDLLQEIVPIIVGFSFDESKSNGATEATVLTALIDRRLLHIRRCIARREKHHENYRQTYGPREGSKPAEPAVLDHIEKTGMRLDLWDMVNSSSRLERIVCKALSRGVPRSGIARRLRLSSYEIERIIDRIRDRFRVRDMHEWRVQ